MSVQGKHVDGNQEGAVDVKKMRTWRQYMNRCVSVFISFKALAEIYVLVCRRGGFNR